jgi:hypothetical protein
MEATLMDRLPLAVDFLFRMEMTVEGTALGQTPLGDRRVGQVTGGRFEGPAMRGVVLPGGADWMLTAPTAPRGSTCGRCCGPRTAS